MGIVRRIDELGRIVIPKEVRKRLRMDSGDLVDISIEEDSVVLSKFHPLLYICKRNISNRYDCNESS